MTVNTYRQHQELEQQLEAARLYLKEEAASDPDMAGEGGNGGDTRVLLCAGGVSGR